MTVLCKFFFHFARCRQYHVTARSYESDNEDRHLVKQREFVGGHSATFVVHVLRRKRILADDNCFLKEKRKYKPIAK